MLRTNYKETSASCLNCEKLNICMLKNDILSEEIEVPDFAKEGCRRYEGEGEQRLYLPVDEILEYIRKQPIYKTDLKELAINEKRLKLTFEALNLEVKEDDEKWTYISHKKIKSQRRNKAGTPVLMCDRNGKVLKRFKMIKEAISYLNLDGGTSISQSLNHGCLAYGYLWIREKEY